jgi:hypothetical protein
MFDPEDTLTHEEILSRFKRLFNRDMTPQEKRAFFLVSETPEKLKNGMNRAPDPLS